MALLSLCQTDPQDALEGAIGKDIINKQHYAVFSSCRNHLRNGYLQLALIKPRAVQELHVDIPRQAQH